MLKFEQSNEAKTVSSLNQRSSVFPQEARYDADTARQVIHLAGRLQDAHRDTLSATEIEEIARETGIEPRFVRQALGLLTEQQTTFSVPKKRNRKRLMLLVPLVYYVLTVLYFSLGLGNSFDRVDGFFLFVLPYLISLFLGGILQRYKASAVAGTVLVLALLLGILTVAFLQAGVSWITAHYLVVAQTMVVGGMLAGVVGAFLGKRYSTWKKYRLRILAALRDDV